MWYVYIARCGDGSLYTGITTDIERRLQSHQSGAGSKYVRSRGVTDVVYREPCPDQSSAMRREREIKSWDRARKLAFVAHA